MEKKKAMGTEISGAKSGTLHPESEFAELYYGVISKLFDLKCHQILNDVKSSLRDIRQLKHLPDKGEEKLFFSKVSDRTPAARCAYMYAYSVLHATMVYFEFSKILRKDQSLSLPLFRRETLKLCCLGGGPGTEAVAIGKAINDFIETGKSALELNVTVVDRHPHWNREVSTVINAVHEISNLLDSEKVIIHADFMKADLLKPFDKSLQEKIKEANIVTIVKLGISIQEKTPVKCNLRLQNMMKSVADCMAENSCLFMLDTAGGNTFRSMMEVLSSYHGSCRLQKSLHKDHCLNVKTIQKMEDLLKSKKDTRTVLPTVRGKISSCFWVKNTAQIEEKKSKVTKKKNKVKEESDAISRSVSSKLKKGNVIQM